MTSTITKANPENHPNKTKKDWCLTSPGHHKLLKLNPDWGLTAHTASVEMPYKFTPFLSVAPFYRYYTQTATKYFAPYTKHAITDQYYTSNYSAAAFDSHFMGVNLRVAPPNGFQDTFLSAMEVRYGHYSQSTDLNSNVISFHFTLK